jgi:hypothetical protein
MEAMIRDFLLAPARTTTQSRDTDLTHRLVCRDAADDDVEADLVGTVLASTVGAGAGGAAYAGTASLGTGSELTTAAC